eukprot:2372107-Amphidinium_carterae.1
MCKRQFVDLADADTIRLVRLSLNECTRSDKYDRALLLDCRELSGPEHHGSGGHFGTSIEIMKQ